MKAIIVTGACVVMAAALLVAIPAASRADIPPSIHLGSPGSFHHSHHVCPDCRLVDDGPPGAILAAPKGSVAGSGDVTPQFRNRHRWGWSIRRLLLLARIL